MKFNISAVTIKDTPHGFRWQIEGFSQDDKKTIFRPSKSRLFRRTFFSYSRNQNKLQQTKTHLLSFSVKVIQNHQKII